MKYCKWESWSCIILRGSHWARLPKLPPNNVVGKGVSTLAQPKIFYLCPYCSVCLLSATSNACFKWAWVQVDFTTLRWRASVQSWARQSRKFNGRMENCFWTRSNDKMWNLIQEYPSITLAVGFIGSNSVKFKHIVSRKLTSAFASAFCSKHLFLLFIKVCAVSQVLFFPIPFVL